MQDPGARLLLWILSQLEQQPAAWCPAGDRAAAAGMVLRPDFKVPAATRMQGWLVRAPAEHVLLLQA